MVWTPGKGGSKASQDYYKEKQAEYGRRPDKKEKKSWSGDYGEKEDRSQDKGGKIPSKKDWYKENADPSQHKFVNENQRLIEKYAAKGKDFTKTEQYRQNMRYLDGVTVNRGGNRGRIYSNDPTLNSPSAEGNAYRRKILAGEGPRNQYALGKQGILNIDPKLARLGLENDPDQFFRFNQQLMEKNPKAYEAARPWSSGKGVRDVISNLTMPGKLLTGIGGALGDLGTATKEGLATLFPGMAKDLGAERDKFLSNLPWNLKKAKTDEVVDETLESVTDPRKSIYDLHPEMENIFTEQVETFKDPAQTQTIESIMKDNTLSPWQKRMAIEDVSGYSDAIQHMDKKQGLGSFDDPDALRSLLTEYSDITGGDLMRGAGHPSPTQYMTDAEKTAFQDSIGATASPDEVDENVSDWSEYTQKFQGQPGFDEEYDWARQGDADPEYDQRLNEVLQAIGVSNNPRQNQIDEIREQIDLNTANRPLNTNWWKQPKLTEDFIRENFQTDLFNQGGIASIDPYMGTMGGGMNPSGWSPDPTVRSVTGYQHGGISTMNPVGGTLGGGMQDMMGMGIMAGGNPMDFNNLRNTNKYYGAF